MAVCHNYSVSQPPNAFHKGAVSIERSQRSFKQQFYNSTRLSYSTTEMELWKRFYADVESAQSIRRHFCRIRGKAQSHKQCSIRPIGIRESVFKNSRTARYPKQQQSCYFDKIFTFASPQMERDEQKTYFTALNPIQKLHRFQNQFSIGKMLH